MPQARVRTSTCLVPGTGSGTWSKTILLSRMTAAFIASDYSPPKIGSV